MPKEAYSLLPEAFRAGRSPRKVLFFFTEEAAKVMSSDPMLSQMRQQFVRMAVASLFAPFAVFGAIACFLLIISKL